MFLNPTCAYRVQPDGEEKRKREVKESRPATEISHAHIVGGGAGKVYEEPSVPHGDCFQTRRPRQLEKRKEHQPNRFTIPFVADQARLPMVGQVGIVFVIALMRMMAQMINAETHRAWIQIRKIGQDADQLVPALISKNEIMSGDVDDDVIGMISERADTVSDHKAGPISELDVLHARQIGNSEKPSAQTSSLISATVGVVAPRCWSKAPRAFLTSCCRNPGSRSKLAIPCRSSVAKLTWIVPPPTR